MIRFACPRCKSVLEAPDPKAGSKVACPKCQQRLQIPIPPPTNKTILAPFIGHGPDPGIRQPNRAAEKSRPDWLSPPPVLSSRDLVSAAVPAPASSAAHPSTMSVRKRLRFSWPSRRFWLGVVAFLPALLIAALVVRLVSTGGYIRPAGQVPEKRSHPRTDEEELVKRYILNNADKDADKIKFLTWGPHMSKKELLGLMQEAGIVELAEIWGKFKQEDIKKWELFKAIIRVRYEGPERIWSLPFLGAPVDQTGKRKTYDGLFIVYGKLVIPLPFRTGLSNEEINNDNWKKKFRIELSKRFPGIER